MSDLGQSRPSNSGPGRPFVRCWSDSVLDFAAQRRSEVPFADIKLALRLLPILLVQLRFGVKSLW
jgi:hypothetical protein